MGNFNNLFAGISVIIGIYALYSAFRGEGSAYKNDYPESIKADANKLLRNFMWIFGPVLIAQGVLDYLGYTLIALIFIGIVVALIITYLVIFFKRFGKVLHGKKK